MKPLFRHPHGNQLRLDMLTSMIFGGISEFVLDDPAPDARLEHVVRLDYAHPPAAPPAPVCIALPAYIREAVAARHAAAGAAGSAPAGPVL